MCPHDGVGGGGPRPRNDSPDSSGIAWPAASEAWTKMGPEMFGRMARPRTRIAEAPSARALSTYSSSRTASVLACATRVKRGR